MWSELGNLYQPATHDGERVTWCVPQPETWPPTLLQRSPISVGRYTYSNGAMETAKCMKCKPAPCVEYYPAEYMLPRLDIPNDKPSKVCPTEAITLGNDGIPVVDQDLCVHCQLCLTRCPVGVIYWDHGQLQVSSQAGAPVIERSGSRAQAIDETATWIRNMREAARQPWEMSSEWLIQALKEFQQLVNSKASTQLAFYPLARNLLRGLGLRAANGRTGDTHWRLDCIVVEPFVMAAELKSPGEERKITPGSARQAVENAAIIEARHQLAPDPISVVIGYALPNERSDVGRALKDVHASYGVSVGLYTVGTLLYLLLRHIAYRFHPLIDLEPLFRETFGACDDKVLHDFWADYFKRRFEIVARGMTYDRASHLASHTPFHSTEAMTAAELITLWHGEAQLIEAIRPVLFG